MWFVVCFLCWLFVFGLGDCCVRLFLFLGCWGCVLNWLWLCLWVVYLLIVFCSLFCRLLYWERVRGGFVLCLICCGWWVYLLWSFFVFLLLKIVILLECRVGCVWLGF